MPDSSEGDQTFPDASLRAPEVVDLATSSPLSGQVGCKRHTAVQMRHEIERLFHASIALLTGLSERERGCTARAASLRQRMAGS